MSKRAIVVLALISALILPVILLYPFSSDNGIYQWMGLVLYRDHGLPYLASWDQNFPGIVVIHAAAIWLFGNSMIGFRSLEFFVQIITIVALYRISRLWLSESSSLFGCMLYALFYVYGPMGCIGQRDNFAVLPLVLASGSMVAAYRIESPSSGYKLAFTGGILYAIATTIRPTFGLLLITPFLTLFNIRHSAGWKMFVSELLGFGTVFVMCVLPYLAQSHGIEQLYLATIKFNFDVYSPFAAHLDVHSFRIEMAMAIVGGWIGLMLFHRRDATIFQEAPKSKSEQQFILFSCGALLIGVISMRKFSAYHFTPFFAFCLPVIAAMVREWTLRLKRSYSILIPIFIVAIVGLYPWKILFSFIENGFSISSVYARVDDDPNYGFKRCTEIIVYLQKNTHANDTVEIASNFAGIRWQTDRPLVSRFTTLFPLITAGQNGSFTSYQKAWRTEFVTQIRHTLPKYIVTDEIQNISGLNALNDPFLQMPGMQEFLEEHYRLDTVIATYSFFKRI